MLEFLVDNPFVAIIILAVLYNLLFGNKDKQKKQQQLQQVKQEAVTKQESSAGDWMKEISAELRKAVEDLDTSSKKSQQVSQSSTLAQPTTPLPAPRSEAESDAYAFHSASEKPLTSVDYDITGIDYDKTAKDYDLTAQDYDLTAKDYDLTAQDYDLTAPSFPSPGTLGTSTVPFGFQGGFHMAQGFAHDPSKPIAVVEIAPHEKRVHSFFDSPGELRRVIITQEILGKPKSLRRGR